MYNVYQHWDPLKVCIVGRSYSPEFYSFITNSRVRTVMERIAEETEEDYQKLIKLLESFGVKVLRPELSNNYLDYLDLTGKIMVPPMTPRDYSAMIGETFYFDKVARCGEPNAQEKWNQMRGSEWPEHAPKSIEEYHRLPELVKQEITDLNISGLILDNVRWWDSVLEQIPNPIVYNNQIDTAMTTRIGRDLYFGTHHYYQNQDDLLLKRQRQFPEYRCHIVDTGGHADATYCPVVPGLIVSLEDIPTYKKTFPDWEVIYLRGESWSKVRKFNQLKEKNKGKWWVPGEELNDDFTDFVESWLSHWVGFVEETVFDVNMLVIDEKNVVCNNYNEKVFEAFERRGITPHIINFRHRYFWDGGLHCITSDIHREGTMKDYFPERG